MDSLTILRRYITLQLPAFFDRCKYASDGLGFPEASRSSHFSEILTHV
jgi:hypothetical protein